MLQCRGGRNVFSWFLATLLLWAAGPAHPEVTTYTDEPAYLTALANLGCTTFQEGFEDNAAWGSARFPNTSASVTSMGIVWTSNHASAVTQPSHITTGSGPARTGSWALFSSPHGDPDVVDSMGFMRDGFTGTLEPGRGQLCGAGGWFTGTFGGQVSLIVDGREANPISLGPVGVLHQFYGVIDTGGFTRFEFRETEGTREDQKFVFADDFTFGVTTGTADSAASVSAASFLPGLPLAAGSIAAAFGQGLAGSTEQATTLPLPTSLADVSVRITDSANAERLAPLFFVSPGQINYLIPQGTQTGPAALTVMHGSQVAATGTLQVDAVAPGLFAANADGRGAAAAVAVKVAADGSQTFQLVFQCGAVPGSCVEAPFDLGGETDQVFLVLFGTGIRGRSALTAVSAQVGGLDAELQYAGPQGDFVGLDQVNVKLPRSLAGRGTVDVLLTVDGRAANPVRVAIQ